MTEHEFLCEIYISYTQKVCIVGRIENDKINSLSFSSVSDSKRTQTIIEEAAIGAVARVSPAFSEYDAIKRDWYRLNLSQSLQNGKRLYHCSEVMGCCFDRSFFSDIIRESFRILAKTATARLADGAYLPVLLHYHELLKKDKNGEQQATGNPKTKYVIDIIKNENYLKLSPDSVVRNLYLAISECAMDLSGCSVSHEIESAYENEIKTAEARLADGAYLLVLRSYQALLSKFNRYDQQAVEYYHQMQPLIGIVESESYLCSSSDPVVRELYRSLAKSASGLYSAHMATRG